MTVRSFSVPRAGLLLARLGIVTVIGNMAHLGWTQQYHVFTRELVSAAGNVRNPVIKLVGATSYVAVSSEDAVNSVSHLRILRRGRVSGQNFDVVTDLQNIVPLDVNVNADSTIMTVVGRIDGTNSKLFIGAFDARTGAAKYQKSLDEATFDLASQVRFQGDLTVVCGVLGDRVEVISFKTLDGTETVTRKFSDVPVRGLPRMEMTGGNAIVVYSGVVAGVPRLGMRCVNIESNNVGWNVVLDLISEGGLLQPLANGDIVFAGNTPDVKSLSPTNPIVVRLSGATGAELRRFVVPRPAGDTAQVVPKALAVRGSTIDINSLHTEGPAANANFRTIIDMSTGEVLSFLGSSRVAVVEGQLDGDGEQHLLQKSAGAVDFFLLSRDPHKINFFGRTDQTASHLSVSDTRQIAVIETTVVANLEAVILTVIEPEVIARGDRIVLTAAEIVDGPPSLILGNDTAGIGAKVVLVSDVQHGTLQLGPDGTLSYRPSSGFLGLDTFTYRISRFGTESTAVATLEMQPDLVGFVPNSFTTKGGIVLNTKLRLAGARVLSDLILQVTDDSTAVSVFPITAKIKVNESDSSVVSISTAPVRTQTIAHLLSGFNGNVVSATVTVVPAQLQSVTSSFNTVIGGALVPMQVTLDGKAPFGGFVVDLTDNSVAVNRPNSVTVPANQTSVSFNASTAPVSASALATITATLNGISKTTSLNVVGCSVAVAPSNIPGGSFAFGTVNITSNAAQSISFALSDNSSATNFGGPTVIIPAGLPTGNFTVTSAPVTAPQSSTITLTAQGVTRSATVTVIPPSLQSLAVNPGSVQGGQAYAGLVQMNGKVAANTAIGLTSASPIVQVPTGVVVSSGNDVGFFPGTTSTVTASVMVIITASFNGVTKTTTLVVTP